MSKLTLEISAETPLADIARMAASIGCRVEATTHDSVRLVPDRSCKVIPMHGKHRGRSAERITAKREPEHPA